MKTFFTSDTHYGHYNIIRYCERPFGSLAEMNDTMIERHNAVVGPYDLVVHLGDFCFGSADYIRSIAARLNGHFVLIQGNHDRKLNVLRDCGWEIHGRTTLTLFEDLGWSTYDYRQDSFEEAKKIVNPNNKVTLMLRHKPEMEGLWMDGHQYHLCGHVHTAWKKREANRRLDPARENIINVGVDQWGYVPRTWPELLAA